MEFSSTYQDIKKILEANASTSTTLKTVLGDEVQLLRQLPEMMGEVVGRCSKMKRISEEDVRNSDELVKQVQNLKRKLEVAVEELKAIDRRKREDAEKNEGKWLFPFFQSNFDTLNN